MSSKVTLLPVPSPLQKQIELSFEQWIIRFAKRLVTILGSGVVITVGSSIYKAIPQLGTAFEMQSVLLLIAGIQFCVIFFAVLFSKKIPEFVDDEEPEPTLAGARGEHEDKIMLASGYQKQKEWRKAKELAVAVLEQFKNYWLGIWICWLCLYLVLATLNVPGLKSEHVKGLLDLLATFFNNCATLTFLFCYTILSEPTIINTPGGRKTTIEWHRWLALLIVFTVVEAICLALAYNILPNTLGLNAYYVTSSANWISGISSATVMALFIGRLDSKFLECPSWFLVLLYLYVAIQPLFALLGPEHKWWTLILMNAALILKCLLFLFLTWLFQTGRLLFYFIRVRRLYDQVDRDFKDFGLLLRKAG